jgi:hypothetical protein
MKNTEQEEVMYQRGVMHGVALAMFCALLCLAIIIPFIRQ